MSFINLFQKKQTTDTTVISENNDFKNITHGAKSAREVDKIRTTKVSRNEAKARSKGNTKPETVRKVPKSVQDTIPYKTTLGNGVILVEEGKFSKTYAFEDINYSGGTRTEQEEQLLLYVDLLNGFDTTADVQITIHNNKINQKDFERRILLREQKDNYNDFRNEYNEMLSNKMVLGQNGIMCQKYITVTVSAIDLETANRKFLTYEMHLRSCFTKLGSEVKMLTNNERIRILTDIFRGVNKEVSTITEKEFKRQAEKNLCCPSYFEFKKDYFMYEDKFSRCIFFRTLPQSVKDEIFKEITETNLNLLVSVNLNFVEPDKAIKMVRRQITGMKTEILNREKKAQQRGVFSDTTPERLKQALSEAEELLSDLNSRNQKMLLANIIIMLTAESYEELIQNTNKIETICRKYVITPALADYQQEDAMASVLPLGNNKLYAKRTLTSESAAVFVPFNSRELAQAGGMYYGLNQITNNIIIFNKKSLPNPNSFILGMPGSGKSFSAKREMVNVSLSTDDEIIIIDPEREYMHLVKALGGEVIFISENSKAYINPLDLTYNPEDKEDDPIMAKYGFFLSFFQTLLKNIKLSPEQCTIIDNCLKEVYVPYLKFLNGVGEEIDCPTLVEYYEILKKYEKREKSEEARVLRVTLELYVTGSYNAFSHKSNVDVESRVVCYDIKELAGNFKEVGLMIVLENLWAAIVRNRLKGKNTRIYIDEMHLLFKSEESANFLEALYKRARKWGGIPTGITQNVEDLLRSPTARTMLGNTQFIQLLNQNATDRIQLQELFKISEELMEYVTNANPGNGLLIVGKYGAVPFKDDFPTNTKLYALMTTRFGEAIAV